MIGLTVMVACLKMATGWPSEKSENVVLLALFVWSLLPVLLALLDIIIERGGVVEYKGIKFDFSKVERISSSGFAVPANIGVRGHPVSDSGTTQILDALAQATSSEIVVIDLEDGQAWWETRLLVLLAGAVRLKNPAIFVFVGTEAGRRNNFQGWGHSSDLLRLLLSAHPEYLRSFVSANAIALQWQLVPPSQPVFPPTAPPSPPTLPAPLPWMQGGMAAQYQWMAFDSQTGLPNELFPEQLLAAELGAKIELKEGPRQISLGRLDELFRSVLIKRKVDHNWAQNRQIEQFFTTDDPHVAITQDGTYMTLASRVAVVNEALKRVLEEKSSPKDRES
jgi:hypothetical protein